MGIMQLAREASPPPALRLPQTKLSRKSNQIARGRIRRFESDMPSQAVSLRRHLQAGLEIASRVRAKHVLTRRGFAAKTSIGPPGPGL
jgi:hypothetical protein